MQELRADRAPATSAHVLLVAFVAACTVAAVVIGSFPLQMSIITIFLFAGLHNMMEFRYFAARMPVKWGRSRVYYLVAVAGVIILAAGYLTLFFGSGNWLWSDDIWTTTIATWNTTLLIWLGVLFYLRGKQRPRSDWGWAVPAALMISAVAWIVPQYFSLGLVYLHPFVAMWFLERQIRRTRPDWLRAYHYCLASIPVFVIVLWIVLSGQPDLPEDTGLFWRIAQHAGSSALPGVSSHLLVATHVFLESIHYAVWILLIPLVDWRAMPWKFSEVPLFSHKSGFPKLFAAAVVVGLFLMAALWAGFSIDYTATRDIYFAFAIAHVLAEFPFLIKML